MERRMATDELTSGSPQSTTAPGKRVLSAETARRIASEVTRYPRRRTALLPSLKLAQEQLGYLPPEAVAEVAELVGVSHASAWELATFYSMLHLEPEGRVIVDVCVQLPCALRGAERLLRDLAAGLGVEPGQVTPDGMVKLVRTPECFGACHRAPMARVNDAYRDTLTPAATQALIAELNTTRVPAREGSVA
jgi:NADH-quinone oxidoreductase subunit E